MASPGYDSKIVRPIVQSIFHLASVKVAITLLNDFHSKNLKVAILKINRGIPCPPSVDPSDIEEIRAQQSLLLIPAGVRRTVMDTVLSLDRSAFLWKRCLLRTRQLDKEHITFYWKSDGRVDESKTVQHSILNTNINIRTRFYLACYYCLEENIQSLWTEMVADGQTGNLETDRESMVRFWVRRMSDRSLLPWRQCILEFFKDPQNCHDGARYSIFFPSLQPKDRKRFLGSLGHAKEYDYLVCLYAATKEEEEDILREHPLKLFFAYFESPLRNFFLETVKQMWKYINKIYFLTLIFSFFDAMDNERVAAYRELFESFWESSPILFQESVRQIPEISEKIDSYLNEFKRKRKALFDEPSTSQRKKS